MSSYTLTHLKQLEAESIHIIREVAAEFENPVMLYSIGKDSSVMVRLAEKAFYPAKPPFPLMHVDTTWKFREMIDFRENYVRKELGWKLIVYINEEGVKQGIEPFTHGSKKHTDIMKTEALQAGAEQVQVRRGLRRCPPRRRKIAGQGAGLLVPRQAPSLGPQEPAARAVEPVQRQGEQGREHPRVSAVELDRARRLAIHPPGKDSDRAALLRRRAAGRRARRQR